jgi:hypothetical protein
VNGEPIDPEHLIRCDACGACTEVSPEVHHGIPRGGMKTGCHSCGARMTIPPTRATLRHHDDQQTLLGVAMIAGGEIERGTAILAETEGAAPRHP